MDAYKSLAIAIVTQAAVDYRRKMKKYGEAPAIERFFLSEWGNLLCFGEADLILERLKDECIRGKKPYGKPMLKHGLVKGRGK